MSEVREKAAKAKQKAALMSSLTTAQKNEALLLMADALVTEQQSIIEANQLDMDRGEQNGTSKSLLDRIKLTEERIAGIAEDCVKLRSFLIRQVLSLTASSGQTDCVSAKFRFRLA